MVKSKGTKSAKKSTKSEVEVEAVENSSDQEEVKTDQTQENGEVDVNLKGKKSKGKAAKKEESEEEGKDNESGHENGDEEGSEEQKKPAAKKAKTPKKAVEKPASEPSRKSSRAPKPVVKEEDGEGYEVEKIVDYRSHRGKPQYLVRWKGYKPEEDTWEDESSLNCPELLQKFKSENAGSKKAKKRSAAKSPAKTPSKKTKKEEKDYEVEEIVGMRVKNGKKEFKIRWKGYKASDDSWEPEKHLSCQDLIDAYLKDHKEDEAEEDKEEEAPAKKARSPKTAKGKKTKAK